jgi:hypothetical protein
MLSTPDQTATNNKTAIRSGIDVLLIVVILGALVAITIFVVNHYKNQSTDAATILGIVVPAFATIGAATFGVTVAYSAGNAKGEAKGEVKAQRAATDAAASTADRFRVFVDPALEAVRDTRSQLATAAYSPPGQNVFMFGVRPEYDNEGRYPAPHVVVEPQRLEQAEALLERLKGAIDGMTRDPERFR